MNKSSGSLYGRFSGRTEIERSLHRHELPHRAPGRLAHPLGTLPVHGYPALPRKDTNLSCRRRPVNDYPGLNSLMRRLATPRMGWPHEGYPHRADTRGRQDPSPGRDPDGDRCRFGNALSQVQVSVTVSSGSQLSSSREASGISPGRAPRSTGRRRP